MAEPRPTHSRDRGALLPASPPCDDAGRRAVASLAAQTRRKAVCCHQSPAPGRFSNEQLAELLDTLEGADSVELKLTVPEPHQRSTVAALALDPLEAQIRQVFFFDTPELALDAPASSRGRDGSRERAATRSSSCAR